MSIPDIPLILAEAGTQVWADAAPEKGLDPRFRGEERAQERVQG